MPSKFKFKRAARTKGIIFWGLRVCRDSKTTCKLLSWYLAKVLMPWGLRMGLSKAIRS
ncbi:MAG: hypothetical protein D6728_09865 [Cyanobacteria bacterium J055]|nr:MAG: hypothetical protein D6728_09865 [Cyanobacteria bacterium J055]